MNTLLVLLFTMLTHQCQAMLHIPESVSKERMHFATKKTVDRASENFKKLLAVAAED